MRLGVTKSIASQDELGGRDGHGGDPGFFKSGRKEPSTETLAKRGQAIEEIRASGEAGVNGNFVKQIAAQELQLAADAKAVMFTELQIVKHIEVKVQDEFRFAAGVGELAIGKSASAGKKMIRDTLHGRNHHRDAARLRRGANAARAT